MKCCPIFYTEQPRCECDAMGSTEIEGTVPVSLLALEEFACHS
jgi:hypothetical protein